VIGAACGRVHSCVAKGTLFIGGIYRLRIVDHVERARPGYWGGVTALEVEQIRGLATHLQIDVVIGGTSVLAPHQYLASIESL
jgi:hypothetical protein